MNTTPVIQPVPTHKPCTTKDACTPPMPPPYKPAPLAPPSLPEKSSLAVDNLALDREPPQPLASPSPVRMDGEVKRCAGMGKSGQRCRIDGRWASGLCKHHDPARREEVRAEQERGRKNAASNRHLRRKSLPGYAVDAYMEQVRKVTGNPESLAGCLDWISEALMRGTISAEMARQLRILAGRRQRIMASYAHARIRKAKYPTTAPTVPIGAPLPDLPPLGPSVSPDAPQGNLRANDETPSFEIPDAPGGPASGQF